MPNYWVIQMKKTLFLCIILLGLQACGQTGPLYLPGEEAPIHVPDEEEDNK